MWIDVILFASISCVFLISMFIIIYNIQSKEFQNKLDRHEAILKKFNQDIITLQKIIQTKKNTPINEKNINIPFIEREYIGSIYDIRDRYGKDEGMHDELDRGTAILKSDEELNQYLWSFGKMHNAKLKLVYKEFFKRISVQNDKIEVIDYACGQGFATISLLNHLEEYNFNIYNIKNIILIEPSKVALKRAYDILHKASNIETINEKLDTISEKNLRTNTDVVKFHLFSNILDMGDDCFNLSKLANNIKKSQKGLNYFICLSPRKPERLDKFMKYFNNYYQIKSSDGVDKINNKWYITYNIFKVNL